MDGLKGAKLPSAPKGGSALVKVAVLGGAGLYAVLNSFYNVEGGHRAIVFNRIEGIKDKVYPEGTHLMIPWIERPIIYDVRARPNLVESTSGSRDLQMVRIGLRVLTRPMPDQLPKIYRNLGENFNERVLPSIIHETLKAVVAQYNASQLITQREVMAPRLLQSVFAAFGDLYLYTFSKLIFNGQVAQWTLFSQLVNWFMFFCITRTLPNSLETVLTVAGLYYWFTAIESSKATSVVSKQHAACEQSVSSRKLALLIAALSCAIRPTSAVTWLYHYMLVFWILFR